ncbi:23816_t:CDS:2, partial [Gigaspora margarita]
DVLLPIDIFSQDDTIEDNELSNIKYKINSIDKNFNSLQIIVDDFVSISKVVF